MNKNILEKIDKNLLLIYKEKEEKFSQNRIIFGFWLYLLSDLVSFSVLFSVYFIFKYFLRETFSYLHFKLLVIFFETIFLLLSSFTFSRSLTYFEYSTNYKKVISWLKLTFFLGLSFLILEFFETYYLFSKKSLVLNAFYSSYLCLIGFHIFHICMGLIWIALIIVYLLNSSNINRLFIQIRLKCCSLFWHFLEIIWICICTSVYLAGNIQ